MTSEVSTSTTSSTVESSSSTTSKPMNVKSATNPPSYDALFQHYIDSNNQQTPAQIRATGDVKLIEAEVKRIEGDVKNKLAVLIIIGTISIIMTIFGCIAFLMKPETAKDVWVIIGPIITAGISGTIGFLTGEKQGNSKS